MGAAGKLPMTKVIARSQRLDLHWVGLVSQIAWDRDHGCGTVAFQLDGLCAWRTVTWMARESARVLAEGYAGLVAPKATLLAWYRRWETKGEGIPCCICGGRGTLTSMAGERTAVIGAEERGVAGAATVEGQSGAHLNSCLMQTKALARKGNGTRRAGISRRGRRE